MAVEDGRPCQAASDLLSMIGEPRVTRGDVHKLHAGLAIPDAVGLQQNLDRLGAIVVTAIHGTLRKQIRRMNAAGVRSVSEARGWRA